MGTILFLIESKRIFTNYTTNPNPNLLIYSLTPARLRRCDFFFLTTVSFLSGSWGTSGALVPPIPTTYLAPKQRLIGTQGCRANPKQGAFQYSRLGDWLFGFFRSFGFCEFLDKFFQITIRIASLFMSFLLLSGSGDIFQNRSLNITASGINAEDSTFTDAQWRFSTEKKILVCAFLLNYLFGT